MYNVISSINTQLNSSNVEYRDRPKVMAVLIAAEVAAKLPLPTSEVKGWSTYFQSTHAATAGELVSKFNEEFVIDVKQTMRVVQHVWGVRYNLVFNPMSLSASAFVNAICCNAEQNGLPKEIEEAICKVDRQCLEYVRNDVRAFFKD